MVAETSCRYFREIGFPEPVDMGLAVERVGTSSVIYRIGLFQGDGDEAAAEGRFVHVYVDNANGPGDRPVRPLPDGDPHGRDRAASRPADPFAGGGCGHVGNDTSAALRRRGTMGSA